MPSSRRIRAKRNQIKGLEMAAQRSHKETGSVQWSASMCYHNFGVCLLLYIYVVRPNIKVAFSALCADGGMIDLSVSKYHVILNVFGRTGAWLIVGSKIIHKLLLCVLSLVMKGNHIHLLERGEDCILSHFSMIFEAGGRKAFIHASEHQLFETWPGYRLSTDYQSWVALMHWSEELLSRVWIYRCLLEKLTCYSQMIDWWSNWQSR